MRARRSGGYTGRSWRVAQRRTPPTASRTAKEISRSTSESAAAPAVSPVPRRPKMYTDATSVLNGRFPEISTTAPNSPTARAKASATPERSAGSTSPATIVGKANGRSLSAFTTPCPTKRSRTSTHAVIVPTTALTSVTTSESPSVSFSALIASRLCTALPKSPAWAASAARGIRTISERYPATKPPPSTSPTGTWTRRAGARSTAALLAKALLDLGHHSRVGIEELLLHLRPAADVADREQPRAHGEVEVLQRALHDRAVAGLPEEPLRRRRIEKLHERLRRGEILRVLEDGDGVLNPDRRLRDHEVRRLALGERELRLVFVREQHVALAAEERLQRLARALVLHGDVVEERVEVLDRLRVRLALAPLRAVRGHHVPAGAARGERVRRDHVDARLDQVFPVLDVLRVAVADDEDDDRARDEALVLVLVPRLVDETGGDERVEVGLQRQVDDVRGLAGDHGAGLRLRCAVGLREVDVSAGGGRLERGDDLCEGFLRRGVGDEVELRRLACSGCRGGRREREGGDGEGQSDAAQVGSLLDYLDWEGRE